MAGAPITDAEVAAAKQAIETAGLTWEKGKTHSIGRHKLAGILGITSIRAAAILNRLRKASEVPVDVISESDEIDGDERTIHLRGTRICTLEQLIEHSQIDTAVWDVERWVCNKWEVGTRIDEGIRVEPLFQVKAWLKKKAHTVLAIAELDSMRKKAEGYAPAYPAVIFKDSHKSGNLLEVSIYDHHFGKLAWARETGGDDYDTKIAERLFDEAFTALIERSNHHAIDELLFVVGNDLQHTDNRLNTTTRGTPQDVDSRYQKVFEAKRNAVIRAIEQARGVAPKVTVRTVFGNHDFLGTWHLGDTLKAWFRNCPGVTIDNEPLFRKCHEHGCVMLMLTHGNAGKLEKYPLDMATQWPEVWGRTWWREAHTGDKHQRRLIELNGVTVRILPSLCPPDAWHSEMGFIGNMRCAEAYTWNRDEGLVGTAVYSVPPQRIAA